MHLSASLSALRTVAVCSHCDVQQCAVHQLVGTTRCSAASRSMRHRARLASASHAVHSCIGGLCVTRSAFWLIC